MKKTSKAKFFIFFLFSLLLLIGVFGVMLVYNSLPCGISSLDNPPPPPEMNAAGLAKTQYVIGNLGGIPVRIPDHFANLPEYDGDPGFGEKRLCPRPKRTYQSKLASFGFEARLPDMAGLSSQELRRHYEQYFDPYWEDRYDPIKSISPWIRIIVRSGERFPSSGFLDRFVNATLSFNAERDGFPILAYMNYEKLLDEEYGLTVYAPLGVNPKTNKAYREDKDAEDLFVHYDKAGKVTTYIQCTNYNLPNLAKTFCSQTISMEPEIKVEIYITYPRYWLPHWEEIQKKIENLILSFQVDKDIPQK